MTLQLRPRLVAAASACLALTACGDRSGAEETVRQALKDPESARFGDFYYNAKTKKGCLGVNAKNSMGGYTGFTQFHLRKDDQGWSWDSDVEEGHQTCKETYADVS